MFDLKNDPGESRNIADTSVDKRNQLHKVLVKWMAEIPSASDISFMEGQDQESLEMLRSLGYIK